jgi:hypothetical protein
MLALNPEDRYPNARAVTEELTRYLAKRRPLGPDRGSP